MAGRHGDRVPRGDGLPVKVVDAASPEGLWKSVQDGVPRHPVNMPEAAGELGSGAAPALAAEGRW